MGLPRISIITPVRNAAATLPRAIESLVAQAYPDMEYLLLDAASTDGTREVIERYRAHIAYVRSHADDGANAAYNEGIARATGGVIGLLNADDWYEPGVLMAVGEAFAQDPALEMVTTEAKVWQADGAGGLRCIKHFTGKSLGLNPAATPMPNARFFRKSLFERYGDFVVTNEAGQRYIASDLEYLLRLSQYSVRTRVLPRVGYHYYAHEGSITFGADPVRMRQMYEERASLAETYLQKNTLPAMYRPRLRRWHRRGTTRAFWRHLAARDFPRAWAEMKRGMRMSKALWLPDAVRLAISGRFEAL